MNDASKFWNDCYAQGKTGWDRGVVHPALLRWIKTKRLAPPSSIIVPGCGRGYEVVELAKHGLNVTAIEFASEPIDFLRKQIDNYEGNVQIVQESIFDFHLSEPVDAVYEQTCLCAIDPSQRALYEQTVFQWLKPGGELFVLFAQKPVDPNQGPPYNCDLDDMRKTFPESRWNWLTKNVAARFDHPSGKLFELAHVLERRHLTP